MIGIHPINSETEYDDAIDEIEHLWGAVSGSPERNRLQVLTILIEAYERRHHPIDPPDPIEALLYVMEKEGLNRRDLEPYLGSRGRVAEILNRRRPLTLEMVRKLNSGLGISAASLIRSYEVQPAHRCRRTVSSAPSAS